MHYGMSGVKSSCQVKGLSRNYNYMKVLSTLIRIPLGILSVNIKMSLWPFDGREASLNHLVSGMTGGRGKSVYLSGYLLITTEPLLFPVFWESSTFLFLFNLFSFPDKRNASLFWMFTIINSDLVTIYLLVLISLISRKIFCVYTF